MYGNRKLVGKTFKDAFPECIEQGLEIKLKKVFLTGKKFSEKESIVKIVDPTGVNSTSRYYNYSCSRIEDENGNSQSIFLHSADVTKSVQDREKMKKYMQELSHTQNLLTEALNVGKLGFCEWRYQSGITFSDHLVKQWNIPKQTMSVEETLRYLPNEDRRKLSAELWKIEDSGKQISCEFKFKHPITQQLIWVAAEGEPTFDQEGRLIRIFGTALDITKRKCVEIKLSEASERLQKAVSVAKVGFFTWDIQTDTITYNEQMRESLGLIKPVLNYADCYACIIPEDLPKIDVEVQAALRGNRNFHLPFRVIRPLDKKTVWIDVQAEVTCDLSGNPIRLFGTTVDITTQKVFEKKLQEARIEADKANSAKSAFLANMSHEIRTPLGAIMGFSQVLTNEKNNADETQRLVSVISKNSAHLLQIIDDILDISKVEAGKMLIEHIEFSLPELIMDIQTAMEFKAKHKGIDFRLKIPTLIPNLIISDPTRIRQILINVIGNGIKFTERGYVELTVTFKDSYLEFLVSDTGCGLSQPQAKKLFKAFTQADISTTRKFGGTGLGLILTRKISEAMGGTFKLQQSTLNKGSQFVATIKVDLPVQAKMIYGKALKFVSHPTSPHSTEGILKDMKILVVEDSEDNQELFQLLLERAGASVDIACNGLEGVEKALGKKFDVVLMDVQMPEMDGHEATQKLREMNYKTPIVALTAHAMKEERERARLSGFSDYLTKPVLRAQLIEMVAKFRPSKGKTEIAQLSLL